MFTGRNHSKDVPGRPHGVAPVMNAPSRCVLGTPLQLVTYSGLAATLQKAARESKTYTVDFSNTQIVTMRRHEPWFRKLTDQFDLFVPDGMPLIWCLNLQGARLRDRVYGPTFMRQCILSSPAPFTHYLVGGSETCVLALRDFFVRKSTDVQIVGCRNGYFGPEDEPEIVAEINHLSPDFIWVGLGTPRQQAWIERNKSRIKRGVILAVGFAFDVNAGTKPDAPQWMQRLGLTWLFRLCSEPLRLGPRYFRYNLLFLFYLVWDALRGCPWQSGKVRTGR